MALRKVMIVRHAEKPPKHGLGPQGIGLDGLPSADELIPRGWQRAGALVTLFAPTDGSAPHLPLERPSAIVAAGTSASSTSLRPQSTAGSVALAREGREAAAASEAIRELATHPGRPLPADHGQTDALTKLRAEQERVIREIEAEAGDAESAKPPRIS